MPTTTTTTTNGRQEGHSGATGSANRANYTFRKYAHTRGIHEMYVYIYEQINVNKRTYGRVHQVVVVAPIYTVRVILYFQTSDVIFHDNKTAVPGRHLVVVCGTHSNITIRQCAA